MGGIDPQNGSGARRIATPDDLTDTRGHSGTFVKSSSSAEERCAICFGHAAPRAYMTDGGDDDEEGEENAGDDGDEGEDEDEESVDPMEADESEADVHEVNGHTVVSLEGADYPDWANFGCCDCEKLCTEKESFRYRECE